MDVKVQSRMGLTGNTVALGLLAAVSLAFGEDAPNVQYKPLKVSAVHEFGQIRSGRLVSRPTSLNDEWVDHFGSFLTQEALVEDRLRLEVGLGGIFQFGKPERVNEVFGGSQYKMFFIGPTIAKATVLFGEPEAPRFTLGGGMFPFKYNPDAMNLGEYLFRSGPYPTYIMNGGVLPLGTMPPTCRVSMRRHASVTWASICFWSRKRTLPRCMIGPSQAWPAIPSRRARWNWAPAST